MINRTNEIFQITFSTDRVRQSKEYNNSRKPKSRTHSRWNSELPKESATNYWKDGPRTNTQDCSGIRTKRQKRHRSTRNKTERSTSSSRLVSTGQDLGVLHLFTSMMMMMMMMKKNMNYHPLRRNSSINGPSESNQSVKIPWHWTEGQSTGGNCDVLRQSANNYENFTNIFNLLRPPKTLPKAPRFPLVCGQLSLWHGSVSPSGTFKWSGGKQRVLALLVKSWFFLRHYIRHYSKYNFII
jgi:hypothetical protein